MAKSSILQKFALLLLVALVLLSLLSSVLYSFIAKPLFVENKKQELLPQAQWLAGQFAKPNNSVEQIEKINNIVSVSYNFYGVFTFIVTDEGVVASTALPDSWSEKLVAEVNEDILSLNAMVCEDSCKERFLLSQKSPQDGEFLYVISPIRHIDEDKTLGAVILLQPLSELSASMRSLNASLFLATLIVASILLIPLTFAAQQMIKPLSKLRKMALSITEGNLDQRIEVSGNNEISDLGNSMNKMAERLNRSFSTLNHEKNRLAAIIEGIKEGIIAVNINGEVTHNNSMIWSLFNRDPELCSLDELLGDFEINKNFEDCLRSGQELNRKLEFEQSTIEMHFSPLLDAHAEVYGAVCLCHDSTESERLEQTRRDYIANISHELRAPLTSMRALLEPLADNLVKDEEKKARYYQILLRENLRLSRLINDTLELSRVQSGNEQIKLGPCYLYSLLQDIALRFSMRASEVKRKLKLELPETEIPAVWSNPDRLEQVLYILFDNALKFSPEESEIKLALSLESDYAEIRVEDEGVGIKPEDLSQVFDRFYKADKAHNLSGTGLGLSIAKEVIEQMNAKLGVKSEYGKGSKFYIRIPYARDVLRSEPYLVDVVGFDLTGPNEDDRKNEKSKYQKMNLWKRNKQKNNKVNSENKDEKDPKGESSK